MDHRIRSHQPLADFDGNVGVLPNMSDSAFTVRLGCLVEGQNVVWDERARSPIATNAGADSVDPTVEIH